MNFAETVAGQQFLNHDFPSLVKSAERIAKAMEEQNKTAAKPYLLISVLDREITAEQFPSLEAAQAHLDDIVEFEAVDLVVVKQVNKKEK